MISNGIKRVLLPSAFSTGALCLLARGEARGLLSPRSLALAMVLFCLAIAFGFVFIIRTTAKERPIQVSSTIDSTTRNQLIWGIRAAKTMIALMALALLAGLNEARTFSAWGPDRGTRVLAMSVGLVMNLLITTTSVKTVVRLQKILHGESINS
jgi:hypothetical protein